MTDYRIQLVDRAGTEKVADLFFTDLTISAVLNGPGAVSFALPLQHPDATADNLLPGAREVRVFRGATKVFGGLLWAVTADVNARAIRCAAEGWFSLLRHRVVTADLVFAEEDQLDIAWGLIAHTQSASSLGITRGSATASGIARSMVWCVEDEAVIGDAITDMASADDGFDFWIDAEKVWRTASPRRGSSTAVVFDAGQNISQLRIDKDAASMANRIIGYDETLNCVPQTTVVEDAGSIATYGLLHGAVTISDLKDESSKGARLAEELRLRKQPSVQATLSTPLNPWADGFGLGDTVALTASAGFVSFASDPFRVISHATTIRGASERTQVVLDSVVA